MGLKIKAIKRGAVANPNFIIKKTDDTEKNHDADIKQGMLNSIGANDAKHKHNRKQNTTGYFA